jgi:glutamate decarboxylase
MPAGAEDLAVLRVVIREGFSADLADRFLDDLTEAVDHLERHGHPDGDAEQTGFTHT